MQHVIIKKGNPIDDDTKKLYRTNMKAIMKRFDPPQQDLNFLVPMPQNVINVEQSGVVRRFPACHLATVKKTIVGTVGSH